MEKMNIYQRMSAITTEIATVGKNLAVELPGGHGYKAVGEVDVLRAVKPLEDKYGVFSYPADREIVESGEIVNQTPRGESRRLFVRIKTTYRFVNRDDKTDYIEIATYGDGVDSQDKAPGKAMTYADKYALLKAYKIQTGEDPDATGSDDLVSRELAKPATAAQMKTLSDMCKSRGLDPKEVARRHGWKGGTVYQDVWTRCINELREDR